MVKIIGQNGAQSLGFTPNTLSALREALESGDGVLSSLSQSMDGTLYCVKDIAREGEAVFYSLAKMLSEESAQQIGARRIDELMSEEIDVLTYRNGEKIQKLDGLLDMVKTYPERTVFLKLRGESAIKPLCKKLKARFETSPALRKKLVVSGFDSATLQTIRSQYPEIPTALHLFPETFSRGIKLYPWSNRDYSCYIPYNADSLKSPLMQRLSPDIFGMEITAIRESTIRSIIREYKHAKIAVWFEKEPRPDDNFALLERLKNDVISPYIDYVFTKYPRQLTTLLYKDGLHATGS